METMTTLKDARSYLFALPEKIDEYLGDEYRKGLNGRIGKPVTGNTSLVLTFAINCRFRHSLLF